MPAVVRVKRRIDEEPLSAFLLNGKRRRIEEDTTSDLSNKEELSAVLKFAGTIKDQDDTATTQLARLTKEEAKELVLEKTRKPVNATERSRKEIRQHQQEERFRVVNCLRTTLEDDDNSDNTKSKEVTIVDIEKQPNNDKTVEIPNSVTATSNQNLSQPSTSAAAAAAMNMPTDSDSGYVYDLYITDGEQLADDFDDNYLSITMLDDILHNEEQFVDDDEYDSDDSNHEQYFRNEYPDEDEHYDDETDSESDPEDESDEDEDTKHLRRKLENFVFGDDKDYNYSDDDNSSDDDSSEDDCSLGRYRDPYIHSIEGEEKNYYDDVDDCY